MSKWIVVGLVLSACGGGSIPELYEATFDFIVTPATCYRSMMAPAQQDTVGAQTAARFRVWDGPDGKSYLEFTDGAARIDMGDAPAVPAPTVLEGTNGATGWTYAVDHTSVDTVPIANTKTTDTSHLALTFQRGGVFKGTLSATSSSTCEGAIGCPAMNPSCTLGPVGFRGTLLYVDKVDVQYGP
jgi:hypothetical protein